MAAAAGALVLLRVAGKVLPLEVNSEHLPVPALTDNIGLTQTFSLFCFIRGAEDLLWFLRLHRRGAVLEDNTQKSKHFGSSCISSEVTSWISSVRTHTLDNDTFLCRTAHTFTQFELVYGGGANQENRKSKNIRRRDRQKKRSVLL